MSRLFAHASIICFFLKRQLNCHIDATRFPSGPHTPPTEISCLHSQVIFQTFEEVFVLFKIWLAARRLIAILSLARPPRDPKSSFRSLLKQLFCCEARVRCQFVANPSPIIFAGALALKVRKIKIKIQFQRNEASQRLVKHNIMISLHSFLKTFSACCFDFNGRREVYLKFTNASLQNTVLHEAYSIRSLSHIHVSTVSFLHSLLLLFHFCVFLSRLSELV